MYTFLPGAAYLAEPSAPETFVVKDILPAGGSMNLYGKAKIGKALALDTPLPTPVGWRTIGDIEPGDFVFGSDGQPTKVLAISPVYTDHPCYALHFMNHDVVTADAEHLWSVKIDGDVWDTLTTEQIAGSTACFFMPSLSGDLVRLHSVVRVNPVPVKCLVVEAEDSLFAIGYRGLLTHNSFLSMGLAMAVSNGDPEWLGLPIMTHGPVAYFQLDTPRSLWHYDLRTMQSGGWDFNRVYFADRGLLPESLYPFDARRPECHAWMKNAINNMPERPVACIIDVWKEFFQGEENNSDIAQEVMAKLTDAAGDCALVIVTHPKKVNPEYGADLLSDVRGSSYLVGRVDCIMRLDEKHVTFKSRTAPETKIRVKRGPGYIWVLDADDHEGLAKQLLLQAPADTPMLQLAKQLSEQTKGQLGVEAARSLLRRMKPGV